MEIDQNVAGQQLAAGTASQLKKKKKMVKAGIFLCYLLVFIFELVAALPPSKPTLPKKWQFMVPIAAGFGIAVAVSEFFYDLLVLREMRIVGLFAAFLANALVFGLYFFKATQNAFGMFTLGMAAVVVASRIDEIVMYQHPDAQIVATASQPQNV